MSNLLLNSIVRGFGLTLGSKGANYVTSPRRTKVNKSTPFNEKQLELIQTFEKIINDVNNVIVQTENSYREGKLTDREYKILILKLEKQQLDATTELEKIKSVKPKKSILGKIVLFVILVYSVIWAIKIMTM